MQIAIIGCGNMGLSLAQALLKSKYTELLIYERDQARQLTLKQQLGTRVFQEIDQSIKQADTILLCIKPQDFKSTAEALRKQLSPEQLLISILAGINTTRLSEELAHNNVVRCMPNIALQVGCAVSVFYGTNLKATDLETSRAIFNTCGTTLQVEREELIDVATALSGSGPAYFYYLCESLALAGQKLGFSQTQAQDLVKQTFIGSAQLLAQTNSGPKTLRDLVTSKGGTTEAAIKHFAESELQEIVFAALEVAVKRAKELSK